MALYNHLHIILTRTLCWRANARTCCSAVKQALALIWNN